MRGGQALVGLIIIIIGIVQFPLLMDSFDAMTYTTATTISTVATGGGVTTGNVTLGSELLGENLDNVEEISSSDTDDAPAPSTYDETHQILTVSGLQASESRALTVEYKTERSDSYIGSILPIVPFVLFVFLTVVGAFTLWKSRQ